MTAANFFFKKKWPHTVSKFIPSYSMSFNLSNIGQVFWIWILKDWLSLKMNEQENRCLVITSSTKHEINEEVPCCDHATMAKKCTKKHDARCKVLFCQSKLIAFLPFLLMLSSFLLNFLMTAKYWCCQERHRGFGSTQAVMGGWGMNRLDTMLFYIITKIVRALWLDERNVCMRVCKLNVTSRCFVFRALITQAWIWVENSTSLLY